MKGNSIHEIALFIPAILSSSQFRMILICETTLKYIRSIELLFEILIIRSVFMRIPLLHFFVGLLLLGGFDREVFGRHLLCHLPQQRPKQRQPARRLVG